MEFNVAKCKIMHIGRNNTAQKYTMFGEELTETEEEKDVGVKVNRNLKPANQCRAAAKAAQTVLSQIGRSFHYRDRHVFVKLYKQYVRPHLEFSTPAWSPWTEADRACLEDVQKRAIRMVSGLRAASYEGKLEELGLTTLTERQHQTDMTQVYKILHGQDRVSKMFKMSTEEDRVTRATADPLNIRTPFARLEVRKNFFTVRVGT